MAKVLAAGRRCRWKRSSSRKRSNGSAAECAGTEGALQKAEVLAEITRLRAQAVKAR